MGGIYCYNWIDIFIAALAMFGHRGNHNPLQLLQVTSLFFLPPTVNCLLVSSVGIFLFLFHPSFPLVLKIMDTFFTKIRSRELCSPAFVRIGIYTVLENG